MFSELLNLEIKWEFFHSIVNHREITFLQQFIHSNWNKMHIETKVIKVLFTGILISLFFVWSTSSAFAFTSSSTFAFTSTSATSSKASLSFMSTTFHSSNIFLRNLNKVSFHVFV